MHTTFIRHRTPGVWSGLQVGAWLGAPGWAGVAHSAAVADGVEEAAVAGITGVTAGQRVTQTGLLVRDATPRRAHGPALQLPCHCILRTGSNVQKQVTDHRWALNCSKKLLKFTAFEKKLHPLHHKSLHQSERRPPRSRQAGGRAHAEGWGRGFSLLGTRQKQTSF